MWRGESGKLFHISDVCTSARSYRDAIAPFENMCDFYSHAFHSRYCQYSGTLFRFPLRTTASELSENIYTVDKLHVLLEALKCDGKLLLLFLRSVDTIEVHEIFANGRQSELFCVSVEERDTLAKERKSFMEQVRRCHTSHGSSVNKSFTLATEFYVNVTNEERSHWLVVTRVGSEKQSILTAAAKQHVLPWVGTALEMGSSSPEGRVFCFLPMPADASCPLPVHVNGTFALNSNRRTLKWPGVERRNDPEAEWNQILVSELLPSCYDYLISKVQQVSQSSDVYSAWPDVNKVQYSYWSGLLSPLFALVFSRACIRCTEISHLLNSWIRINEATFLPECEQISRVVITTVTSCGLRLAKIPGSVWSALRMMGQGTSILFPTLVRAKLRQTPRSYQSLSRADKLELLCYCLSDQNYSDLHGIFLLPLANGTFIQFQLRGYHYTSQCYICTQYCPHAVFPNERVDNVLVNLVEDADLMSKLESVASSNMTQLQKLTVPTVASLLPRCFPPEWQSKKVVTLPHRQIPDDWLERFWNWVQPYDLSHFCNLLLVPIEGIYGVTLTRLSVQSESSILYSETKINQSLTFMSALRKLGAQHTSLSHYKYLYHRQRFIYWNQFTPDGILNTLYNACDGHVERLQSCNLTSDEASYIRYHLSGAYSLNAQQQRILSCIPTFETVNHNQLFSVSKACQQSWQGRALLEPQSGILIQEDCLPSNVVVLYQSSYQNKLVNLLSRENVNKPSCGLDLILDTIFPIIVSGSYPTSQLTKLMEEVLMHFSSFRQNRRYRELLKCVQEIPFLTISSSSVRKRPNELFDPSVQILRCLYEGEAVFPLAPFNTNDYLPQLRECGLCQTVSPQNIIDIIWSISELSNVSNTNISRARNVLKYLNSHLPTIPRTIVSVPGQYQMYFTNALCYLVQNRCWLPIRCSPPDDYPSVLNWKGCAYKAHFLALNTCSTLLTHETANLTPHLVGSQMLIVDHTASAALYGVIGPSSSNTQHVVAHFKQIIEYQIQIDSNYMKKVIEIMYNFFNKQSKRELYQLKNLSEWIWLQKFEKFISPAEAAMGLNPNFQQNLEPFLYVLPDGLSNNFFNLFSDAGVCRYFSKAQVVTVLQKMHDGGLRGITTIQAWRIVMAILNWLTEEGMEGIEQDDLFVPIESETNELKLELATEVVYTDNEFLKEYLTGTESEESYTLVHSKVRPDMAKALGLTPLSQFLDISEDTFEDAGQCEPLTTRLKNILKDYKDGLTIIKELLQNADDAEATEVNICYDARVHSADPKKLFFPGMADSHGPALIVHNNKTFSDDDFKNITQLAGGTKQNKPLKIGKFGIGFCSVYHITDVPSFISRDYLYIFDPTLKHLQKAVSNPARPGKKTKFTQKVISTSQQLQPYTDLFEFDPKRPYDGTMFRLPFRKAYSEISSTLYNESTVQELLKEMKESNYNLLLFLQHVKKITFSRFDPDKSAPTQLLEIHLSEVLTSHNIKLLKVNCNVGREQYWLIASSSCWDRDETYHTASVACSLEATPHQDQQCFKVKKTEGEIFCFLPLSLKTGLPVHVSSNFAVMNNRRGIWTSSYKETSEVQWNINLMKSAIPDAYHQLVQYLHELQSNGRLLEYSDVFYTLWPVKAELQEHNPWDHCVDCFYQKVLDSALFYSAATSGWLTLDECKFVEPRILCRLPSQQIPQCVCDIIFQLKLPVVDLPQKYQNHFLLDGYFLTEEQFVKIFFYRIESIVQESRNKTLFHMFEVHDVIRGNNSSRSQAIDQCLRDNPCVPCSPDGCVLRHAQDTVDPDCLFSGLFDCSENRFPLENFCSSHLVKSSLASLGMTKSIMPWSMLAEKAKSIVKLYYHNSQKALERSALIIKSINKNLENQSNVSEEKADLATIPFIPVLQKPSTYLPLPWGGEGHQFLSGDKLMIQGQQERFPFQSSPSQRNIYLAGSQVSFVCTAEPVSGGCGLIPFEVQSFLKVRSEPTCCEAIEHLKEVILLFPSKVPADVKTKSTFLESISTICRHVYEYLNSLIKPGPDSVSSKEQLEVELKDLDCIWTGQMFVSPKVVAQNWKSDGPYLYKVPECLSSRKMFAQAVGVKEKFSMDDLFKALFQMYEDYRENPVNDQCKAVIRELIPLIQDDLPSQLSAEVMLPDTDFIIRKAKDLSYNDAPWCPHEEDCVYVHDSIPRDCALKLGVKPVRSRRLDVYSSKKEDNWAGFPFGQHEKLTQRIQNILRDYPFDATFLKELLQNADDAKATKMYVILDKRHHRTERMISEVWKDLQGPALLVWNDSVFSEKDIQGIQQLGLGSKRSDSDSIGQYGIGFNVVYHITDCPSFVSNGETLCILDPHCRYVPGASALKPGRRFDNLKSGFWNDFSDLKSAYLQDNLPKCPKEVINKGSLFRFPLRHTQELMDMSQIVPPRKTSTGFHKQPPLTVHKFSSQLSQWVLELKEAFFFLNHVREFKFFIIDNVIPSVNPEICYQVNMKEDALKTCREHTEKVADFTADSTSPHSAIYYMELVTMSLKPREKRKSEKWLIQQGIGDIEEDEMQEWKFIHQVKPRHGLAAPLDPLLKDFTGSVFCFLPLPIKSGLPVHVNGNFILDSSRRALWNSTCRDDRNKWNKKLLKAISSSYAKFLVDSRSYFTRRSYKSIDELLLGTNGYYSTFPITKAPKPDPTDASHQNNVPGKQLTKAMYQASAPAPEAQWLDLARDVYVKLSENNAKILLCIEIEQESTDHKVVWHKLKALKEKQVHFLSKFTPRAVKETLKAIGMHITCAPYKILKQFKAVNFHLPDTNPETVFEYYKAYFESLYIANSNEFPCHIEDTAFSTARNFKKFSSYLLKKSEANEKEMEFPSSPFGCPLLLTADSMLRIFDDGNKVFASEYSESFKSSLENFLCHDMLELNYVKSYFLTTEDSKEALCSVLNDEMPEELCGCEVVVQANQYFVGDWLKKLWDCLRNDPIFCHHLPFILENWALLLTEENELYSLKSSLLPLISVLRSESTYPQYSAVIEVLKRLGMPFLNQAVVEADQECVKGKCPHITSCHETLLNLVHLHTKIDISFKQGDPSLDTLIGYLTEIHFRSCEGHQSVTRIRQLPFFEDVNGQLTALGDKKTFVWPYNVDDSGRDRWMKTENVIFLKMHGSWKKLVSSPSDLRVEGLSSEDVYVRFIFPHFKLLSKEERYKQLQHIRDILFFPIKARSGMRGESSATNFVNALKNLPCIEGDDAILRPVSDFCNPDDMVFKAFPHYFRRLPSDFLKDEWRRKKLFSEIGLKMFPTEEDLLMLCRDVADGKVNGLKAISSLLLDTILKRLTGEYFVPKFSNQFLSKVSEIPFVLAANLSHLTWVLPTASPSKHISIDGEQFALTKLHGAATTSHSSLLWTVRPIITLKVWLYDTAVLQALGIIAQPSTKDVILNIRRVCHSRFANTKLFDKFPDSCLPPKNATDLFEIISCHFHFLKSAESSDLEGLSDELCIPVSTASQDESEASFKGAVLVRPQQVLFTASETKCYYPFLHSLASSLSGLLPVLEKLGVKRSLELSHLRLVLELAFLSSDGQEIDVNTKKVVEHALVKLHRKLDAQVGVPSKLALSPLYLLNHHHKLCSSVNLFSREWLYKLKPDFSLLAQHGISLLLLPKEILSEKDFCRYLPKEVKPKSLPDACKVDVLTPSTSVICKCSFAQNLTNKIKSPVFHSIVLKFLKHKITEKQQKTAIESALNTFLSNYNIIVIDNLCLSVVYKQQQIGTMKCNHHFQTASNHQHILYIDAKVTKVKGKKILDEVAKRMTSSKSQEVVHVTSSELREFQETVSRLLSAETEQDMDDIFDDEGVPFSTDEMMFDLVNPELGGVLPKQLSHRLDQDYKNLFRADEWVGYEVEEGKVIFAKVVLPVMEDCDENGRPMWYIICFSKEDEEGKKVSVLEMYKFIRGKVPSVETSDSQELEVAEGIGQSVQRDVQESSARDIKRELCKELKRIWQLPEEERNRAVRRLYLMWHPDKNPNRIHLADDVFKYLKCQVERLQEGLALLDPEEDRSVTFPTNRGSYWHDTFKRWHSTAQQHSASSQSERRSRRQHRSRQAEERPDFWDTPTGPVPEPEEAKRWLRQAEADFSSLLSLGNHYDCACFMAHQVAEKALKAGMYAICGLSQENLTHHQLSGHAWNLSLERPALTDGLSTLTCSLESFYLDTRYPNRHAGPTTIPSDVFTSEQAREARESAEAILEMMKRLVN